MKSKGFTLIELLAVIVILALIALVTIPMINNVIEKAKKGALEDSVYGLKSAAELYYSTTGTSETIEFICDGTGCKDGDKKLPFKGIVNLGRVKLFSDGKVSICIENDNFASSILAEDKKANTTTGSCDYTKEEYAITELVSANEYKKVKADLDLIKESLYNKTLISSTSNSAESIVNDINNIDLNQGEAANKKGIADALQYSGLGITEDMSWDEINSILAAVFPKGPTLKLSTSSETYIAIVYLDPTDLTKTCNVKNSVSLTGTKTGCMKFYAFAETDNTYDLILDHNTTPLVAYNSDNINTTMKEVKNALESDTKGWHGNPRLITADEIALITGNNSFKGATAPSTAHFYFETNTSNLPNSYSGIYSWLYDYTAECISYGCNIDDNNKYVYDNLGNTSGTYGYWTSTPVSNVSIYAWYVLNAGALAPLPVDATNRGVRPVITIPKSIFS